MGELTLPENVKMLRYDEDIVLVGKGLTQQMFESIMERLPKPQRLLITGWVRTAT
jgi:hypothetical protein